jgi:hypothetical protein
MKKLTTVLMVLSLVLGGVALAVAADVPQTSKNLNLSAMQKISDQEAQNIRGTGAGFGPGVFINTTCTTPIINDYGHNYLYGANNNPKTPIFHNYGGRNTQ